MLGRRKYGWVGEMTTSGVGEGLPTQGATLLVRVEGETSAVSASCAAAVGAAVSVAGALAVAVCAAADALLQWVNQPAAGAALTRLQRRLSVRREATNSATSSISEGWWVDIMAGASSSRTP